MCFPRWDSDAVFSSLIGGPGGYAITPRDRCVWGGYYEPGSLIWRSRWVTVDAIIECREALALPSHPDRAVILRRVIARHGTARACDVAESARRLRPASRCAGSRRDESGTGTGEAGDDIHLAWSGGERRHPGPDGHGGKALELDARARAGRSPRPRARPRADGGPTAPAGRRASRGRQPKPPGASAFPSSSARSPSATHATPTRSCPGSPAPAAGWSRRPPHRCPSAPGKGRNYDYRYVWISDQCYAGQAVAKAGAHTAPRRRRAFRARPAARRRPADLMPAYTTSGGRVPDQRSLGPAGLPGGTDVVGNWVNQQFQLDAFGEALLLFAAAARHDHLDADGWRAAEIAVEAIEQRWHEPDAGIWEIDPDAWTHSRLICAAGLRAISASTRPAANRPPAGSRSPTRSPPTPPRTHCTPPGAGSAHRPTRASTQHCCCRRCAARSPPTTRARSPRCTRSPQSSPRTATATATAPTSDRSDSQKAHSCCAGS